MKIWKTSRRVYLDNASASPASATALRVFGEALLQEGNPGSPHTEGRLAHALLEGARTHVAVLAEVRPDAVIFTGNATEANAIAIQGSIEALALGGRAHTDMHVLFDPGAHASLTHTIEALLEKGVRIEELRYVRGSLDMHALAKQIQDSTVLIAVSAICGETGAFTAVRDIRRVLDLAQKNQHTKALLHVDASQLPRVGPFELTRLGADTLTLDAQKVGGVRGIGALIAPRRVPLKPLMLGGGQERGLRPGTPSHALARAFAQALTEAHEDRHYFLEHSKELRTQLLDGIASIQNVVVNEGKEQAPHILNLSVLGRDTDYLAVLLDEAGFAVSTRSSCETNEPGSRAVLAMSGCRERAESTLRISFGPTTTGRDISEFTQALIRSVEFLDSAGIL